MKQKTKFKNFGKIGYWLSVSAPKQPYQSIST